MRWVVGKLSGAGKNGVDGNDFDHTVAVGEGFKSFYQVRCPGFLPHRQPAGELSSHQSGQNAGFEGRRPPCAVSPAPEVAGAGFQPVAAGICEDGLSGTALLGGLQGEPGGEVVAGFVGGEGAVKLGGVG